MQTMTHKKHSSDSWKFLPAPNKLSYDYYLKESIHKNLSLTLIFNQIKKISSEQLIIKFENSVMLSRISNESYRTKTLEILNKLNTPQKTMPPHLYKITDSSYLDFFHKYHKKPKGQFSHFAIIDYDSIIDVITHSIPEVKIASNQEGPNQ